MVTLVNLISRAERPLIFRFQHKYIKLLCYFNFKKFFNRGTVSIRLKMTKKERIEELKLEMGHSKLRNSRICAIFVKRL